MSKVTRMSELRLKLWFNLKTHHRQYLSKKGYSHLYLEYLSFSDLKRVSKSIKNERLLRELKQLHGLRLAA